MTTTWFPSQRTYTTRGTAVVGRTAYDGGPTTPMWFEITVLRTHRQKNPTYQGTIALRADGWHADAPNQGGLVGIYADYIDAENALVKRRTGIVSAFPWDGPRPQRPVTDDCPICGWERTDGICYRTELHWTAASIAAEAETRRARHAAEDEARQSRPVTA